MLIKLLFSLIAIILTLIIVIGIHELGHYVAARLFNIKIIRFCLGLGKPIYIIVDRRGIEYAIGPIPLGGYVKLLDEREGEVDKNEGHLALNQQAIWKRTIVILLGPAFNFLLALFAFYLAFVCGIVRPLPIIGIVMPNSLAAQVGIKSQQQILEIDHHKTESTWEAAIYLLSRIGDTGNIELKSIDVNNQKISNFQIPLSQWKINALKPNPLESLGIQFIKPPYTETQLYHSKYSLMTAWPAAFSEIGLLLWFQGKMFSKLFTGKLSLKSFAGPLSIFQGATIALSQGFVAFVLFIGLLSIAVFLLNILPIPGLDGGQLLYLGIEKITGKPVSTAFQVLAYRLSFIFFCVILVQLMLNDLLRWLIH